MKFYLSLLIIVAFNNSFAFDYKPLNALDYYPTQDSDWKFMSTKEAGFNSGKLKELLDYTFSNDGFQTDALIIIKDGRIVVEKYDEVAGYKKDTPHMLWSFSKSLTNGILGVAEKKGILNRQTKLSKYFPKLKEMSTEQGRSENLTLQNLMNMSSGFEYYEEHPDNIVLSSSIYTQFSWPGYRNMAEFMINPDHRKMIAEPGTRFNYSTGDCLLTMALFKKKLKEYYACYEHQDCTKKHTEIYKNFMYEELFERIGMNNTLIEQDGSGLIHTGAFGWSTVRDMAKFALLYFNDGVWDNGDGILNEEDRLFPKNWVYDSVGGYQSIAPALVKAKTEEGKQRLNTESYSNFWWLNYKLPMNSRKPYPSLPENTFLAMGYRGQTLAALPDEGVIIIRLASDGSLNGLSGKIDRQKFFKLFMEALNKKGVEVEKNKEDCDGLFCLSTNIINNIIKAPLSFLQIFTGLITKNANTELNYNDAFALTIAKDLCSCIFVSRRSEQWCNEKHFQYKAFKQTGFISEANVDYENKNVSISNNALPGLGVIPVLFNVEQFTASYIDKKRGCMISEVKEQGLRYIFFEDEVPCVDYFGEVERKENGACRRK